MSLTRLYQLAVNAMRTAMRFMVVFEFIDG